MQDRGSSKEIMAALRELSERLTRIESRLDALERKLASEKDKERDKTCPECSTLVGCLEDCCDDPEELRKKVRDVRSGHSN